MNDFSNIVYVYRMRRPTAGSSLVDDQMREAHHYANALVEIECRRRSAAREALGDDRDSELSALSASCDAAWQAVHDARTAIKEQRAATRSRSDTAEQRAHVVALRERAQEESARLKAVRSASRSPEVLGALKKIDEIARQESKAAYAASGAFWGTKLRVDADADRSRKSLPKLWRRDKRTNELEPNDPRFRRWSGEGEVAVQIQHGLAAEHVFGCQDGRVQIRMTPLPALADGEVRSRRAQTRRFGVLRLRVGSDGRDPVWAEWPLLMHRPLPEGAIVTWAVAKCTKVSNFQYWHLHLSLRVPDGKRASGSRSAVERCGNGAVAVNFGWRELPYGGRRVAYWRDQDGNEGEILEDARVLSGMRKVEDLCSIRSKTRDALRAALAAWLAQRELPEWMREWTEQIDPKFTLAWRSAKRFVRLLRHWEGERWEGDGEGFELLREWAHGSRDATTGKQAGGDAHLWRWESYQRKNTLRRRLDLYRVQAATLARRYGMLIIEDFDLRRTQRLARTEDEEVDVAAVRLQQHDAGIYELRTAMREAFLARGGRVETVGARFNTQRCAFCGCEERWDAAPEVEHTCSGCGKTWDQDSNNTINILRRLGELGERSNGTPVPTVKSLAKWARRKQRNVTARNDDGNPAKPLEG